MESMHLPIWEGPRASVEATGACLLPESDYFITDRSEGNKWGGQAATEGPLYSSLEFNRQRGRL